MKLKLTLILIGLLFSPLAAAQPATKADVQALAAKMSTLDDKVNEIDKRLTRLETKVDEMDKRLTNQIDEMDKRLINRIEELDKRLTVRIDALFWAIGGLIGVVLAVIALPQLLEFFQGRRERIEFQKRIDALEFRMGQHQHEIAELKARSIITRS